MASNTGKFKSMLATCLCIIEDLEANGNRNRSYGIRVGDTVTIHESIPRKYVIVSRGVMDNNKVYVVDNSLNTFKPKVIDVVAEWCKVIKPIENKGWLAKLIIIIKIKRYIYNGKTR